MIPSLTPPESPTKQTSLEILAGFTIRPVDAPLEPILSEFNRLVRRYFALIEDEAFDQTKWLRQVQLAIAELYTSALRLPDTEPSGRDAPRMSPEEYKRLVGMTYDKLDGLSNFYWLVLHPLGPEEEPAGGLVTDDLADIYRDLHSGTALLDAGGSGEDVVWEWRFRRNLNSRMAWL